MANYLFDKYNVQFGPWSGESTSYDTYGRGGSEVTSRGTINWDGNQYYGSGFFNYGIGSSYTGYSNGLTSASRYYNTWTNRVEGDGIYRYERTTYTRTRTATRTTLAQSNIIGRINDYPANGLHYDGFWYVRTGIENKPIITAPNGGESVNELFTITFTDNKPKSDIRYQIQLSLNNGQTWKDIVALTAVGATSYQYNFINEPATSVAKVRVRAYDGQNYGAWDESNGVFTIQHNVAPTIPTQLSPSGVIVDRTKTQRLSWKHNDADAQSKAVIEWRSQGASTWNITTSSGADQFFFVPANTFPTGQIEWRVRTYDQESLVSPYSAIAVFSSAEPTDAPEIISPTSPVAVSRPVVQWTGVAQASYQIIIEDALGEVVWDTGEVVSGVKARTVGVDMLNGGTYTIKLRIKDGSGLFSTFVEKTVVMSYTPPVKPEVSLYTEKAGVRFSINNPPPTGTQPNVTENELYKLINGEWIRIATNLLTTYTDYALASEEVAKYRVHALGENGTFSESDVMEVVAPKLRGVYLFDVQDPERTIHNFVADGGGRSENLQREHAFRQFAGRKRPVIEYGIASTYQISAPIELLRDNIGRERLIQFANDGAILLYRDGRGRKFYTTLPNLSMSDVFYGNSLELDLMEIDYREEV